MVPFPVGSSESTAREAQARYPRARGSATFLDACSWFRFRRAAGTFGDVRRAASALEGPSSSIRTMLRIHLSMLVEDASCQGRQLLRAYGLAQAGLENCRASLHVIGGSDSRVRTSAGWSVRDRRSGTDGLFAGPPLRQPGCLPNGKDCGWRALLLTGPPPNTAEGPWLCVPASRRVCPFEDERRCDPGKTSRLAPDNAIKAGSIVATQL
jgi:hypothetical protein